MLFYFPDFRTRFIKIPKNACSTVMTSLGWSVTQGLNPHQFDGVFGRPVAGAEEWPVLAVYRDPYDRLVSSYLEKIVFPKPHEPFAHGIIDTIWQQTRRAVRQSPSLSVTFSELVTFVCAQDDDEVDHHWKSQSWFSRFAAPTIALRMERLAEEWQRHAALAAIPLRNFTPHSTRSDLQVGSGLWDVAGESLAGFKLVAGAFPAQSRFREPALEAMVRQRFAEDYAILSRLDAPPAPTLRTLAPALSGD